MEWGETLQLPAKAAELRGRDAGLQRKVWILTCAEFKLEATLAPPGGNAYVGPNLRRGAVLGTDAQIWELSTWKRQVSEQTEGLNLGWMSKKECPSLTLLRGNYFRKNIENTISSFMVDQPRGFFLFDVISASYGKYFQGKKITKEKNSQRVYKV